jgi:Icc-related predicted phosphoesterase
MVDFLDSGLAAEREGAILAGALSLQSAAKLQQERCFRMKKRFKLFFATDFHGSEKCFRKWVNAGKFYDCDVLIMGGDLTGKVLVPLVGRSDGAHVEFLGEPQVLKGEDEVAQMIENIRFNGMYPYPCDESEFDRLQNDDQYREQVFDAAMVKRLQEWMELADERLEGTGIIAMATGGNDDILAVNDVIHSSKHVMNVDDAVVPIGDGYQILSSSYSNLTPWNTHRELQEQELLAVLEGLVEQLDPGRKAIFNLHVPPINSTLDIAPKLDEKLRPITEGGSQVMIAVGSTAVREVIEQEQPVLSLHGHIHESRGVTRIGRTLAINPGSNYAAGVLEAAMVLLDEKKGVVNYQLITG